MKPSIDIKSITSANQALRWWLVHCYLYYIANQPLISDKDFDQLTQWLKMGWNNITHHHKSLITLEDLDAGTGFAIQYPPLVEMAAWQLLRDYYATELIKTLPANRPAKFLGKSCASAIIPPTPTVPKNDSLFDLI